MFKIKYHGGKGMTYKQAAVQAKQEADAVRLEGTRQGRQGKQMSEGEEPANHYEGVSIENDEKKA